MVTAAAMIGAFAAGLLVGVVVTVVIVRRELRERESWRQWFNGRR